MDHETESKRRSVAPASALVVVLTLLMAPAASLAGPATDEYKLDLPGVERASLENIATVEARVPVEPLGVVAESAPAESPLQATGSTLEAAPLLVIALVAAGLTWIGVAMVRRRGVRS